MTHLRVAPCLRPVRPDAVLLHRPRGARSAALHACYAAGQRAACMANPNDVTKIG